MMFVGLDGHLIPENCGRLGMCEKLNAINEPHPLAGVAHL